MAEHDQSFRNFQEWVCKASSWLTRHPKFNDSRRSGYGPHFTAICFDTKGRQCTCGRDMQRAHDEGAFPVRWIWPDQVAELASKQFSAEEPTK